MRLPTILLVFLTSLLPLISSTKPHCPPHPVSHAEQRLIFTRFVQRFYIERQYTQALTEYISTDYIQHNPFVTDGRAAVITYFQQPLFQFFRTEVERLIVDGNFAMLYRRSTVPGSPVTAGVDIYRFEGSCIVEHWDVIQAVPPNATNPHAFF